MTCQEFNNQLPDYLDETLAPAVRADADQHLQACPACRLALRQEQALARSLQTALERETAHLTLTPDARAAVFRAARSLPKEAPSRRKAWPWVFGHPVPALAAAAAIVAVLLITTQLHRPRVDPRVQPGRGRNTWSIDVPFQSGQVVGLIHADFSEP